MHTNVNKAVLIIAALSILLGLSIGQLQEQHRRIQNLEGRSFDKGFIYIGNKHGIHHIPSEDATRQMEEMRARLDMERARLEKERVKLHRELDRFLRLEEKRIHRDQTRQEHVILKEEL